ncbi:MAG: hypothetical protein K2N22_06785 [Clostridia bacterium]|nr:hypothetical protein [Clostridia bacterium]
MVAKVSDVKTEQKIEIGDVRFRTLCERIADASNIYAQMRSGLLPANEETKSSMRKVVKTLCMELNAVVNDDEAKGRE